MRGAIIFAAALFATGCTTTEPQVVYKTIEVPVPVARSCVPANFPAAPEYQVTIGTIVGAPDAADRLRQGPQGILERDARLAEVEPVIAGCR